jgi:hypothetical protein
MIFIFNTLITLARIFLEYQASLQESPSKGGDPAAGSPTATLLRLHPNHYPYLRHPHLIPKYKLAKVASGTNSFRGVTGGVYKARERIHRVVLMRDY